MDYGEAIDNAVLAHGAWRQRLSSAIATGSSEFAAAQVKVDNRCDFGKWFYSLPPAVRATEGAKSVQKLHAEFHVAAAEVLALVAQGRVEDAKLGMGSKGEYASISGQLVLALMLWKATIGKE